MFNLTMMTRTQYRVIKTTLLFYQSFIVESSHRWLRRVASFRPYKAKQVGDTGPVESARRSNSRALGSPFSGFTGHCPFKVAGTVFFYFFYCKFISAYSFFLIVVGDDTKSI